MATTNVNQLRCSAAGVCPPIDVGGTPPNGLAFQAEHGAIDFVGTAKLQGSLNGDTWEDLGAVAAAMQPVQVAGVYKFIRVNVTAYTSGEIVAYVGAYSP